MIAVLVVLVVLLFLRTIRATIIAGVSLPISAVASIGVWYVLEKVLLVQLPKGAWIEGVVPF